MSGGVSAEDAIGVAHGWCSECDGTGVAGIGAEGVTYDCPNLDVHRAFERLRPGGVPARPTREALVSILTSAQHAPMQTHDGRTGECQVCPVPLHALSPEEIADALLAAGHLWTEQPTGDDRPPTKLGEVINDLNGLLDSLDDSVIADESERENVYRAIDEVRRSIDVEPSVPSAPVVDRAAAEVALHDIQVAMIHGNVAPDMETRAALFNHGFETAMAQQLADDPGAADEWLAEHDSEVRAEQREKDARIVERRFAGVLPVASLSLAAAIRSAGVAAGSGYGADPAGESSDIGRES